MAAEKENKVKPSLKKNGPPDGAPQGGPPPDGAPQVAPPGAAPPAPAPALPPISIPGSQAVGRGIRLRPHQPYELKPVLFEPDVYWKGKEGSNYTSPETGRDYTFPYGYEVDPSSPLPTGRVIGKTVIYQSFEHLDKSFGVEASMSASGTGFSVNSNANMLQKSSFEGEAYYAVRNSFIPFWSLYLPTTADVIGQKIFDSLPDEFDISKRDLYEHFFDQYGTHYVRRAWVGGQATLVFSVEKKTNISAQDIQAGISASMTAVGSASVNVKKQQTQKRVMENSEVTVLGQGGDYTKLGAMKEVSDSTYQQWLESVKNNPKVIEIEVVGLWTLVKNKQKAAALAEAYEKATSFKNLSSVMYVSGALYFFRGSEYSLYDLKSGKVDPPKPIADKWKELAKLGSIDSAVNWKDHSSLEEEDHIAFIFKGNTFIKYNMTKDVIEEGYPKLIQGKDENGNPYWPGLTFTQIDSVENWRDGTVYFFSGKQYSRFNMKANKVDPGYPKLISEGWPDLPFERIDATVTWGDGKAYFFRGNEFVRYDMIEYEVDPGYPKKLVGSYVEDWNFLDQ